jgi:hypothetical protein
MVNLGLFINKNDFFLSEKFWIFVVLKIARCSNVFSDPFFSMFALLLVFNFISKFY